MIIINIVRSIGPTSMPWNDLYYSTRSKSPGIAHTPIAVKTLFKKEFHRLERCNNKIYGYIDSSFIACIFRVLKIYYRKRVERKKIAIHIHNPSLWVLTLIIKVFCPKIVVIVNLHNDWRFFRLHQKIGMIILAFLSNHLITVSNALKKTLPRICVKKLIRNGNISAIPNGVRLSDFMKFNNQNREKKMAIVARMVPQKNCFFAIDILAKSKSIESLIWIGDGNQKKLIIEYAKKMNVLNKLDLKGVVSRKQVYSILSDISVYIAPSKWEGIGVANLEAAALGCIPFLSNIPPHREIAENLEIETYSLSDSGIWAAEIDELLKNNLIDSRSRISALVKKKYDLNLAIDKYKSIYDKHLS